MGPNNSSITRVVPIFDHLFGGDPTGRSWMDYLLRIGSRAKPVGLPVDAGVLPPDHPRWWGKHERRFAPPVTLLRWLVENITEAQVFAGADREPVHSRRLALARRDPATVAAALGGIESGSWNRKWYVLEGPSAPDATLETDRILLVIEGKRTEKSCTTKTKWMPRRSQLLRHMDAALEVAATRRVFGLLIVEGTGTDPLEVDSFWRDQADAQVAADLLECSLPHRSRQERSTIAGGVLGVVTWQRVCSDRGIPWPPAF